MQMQMQMGFQLVPYPAVPLEEVYVPQRLSRGIRSKHTSDLRWVAAAIFAILILMLAVGPAQGFLTGKINTNNAPLEILSRASAMSVEFLGAALIAAMFSSVTAAFAGLYQLGKQRFSTVDVFSSEIAARMRILAADNSVARIIGGSVHSVGDSTQKANQSTPAPGPSQESQFETFHRRSSDLGALSSSVVDHVTAFYSFHMAARDELRVLERSLADASNAALLRDNVVNVMFMVDLMAFNAIRALDDLVETPEHRLHCRQISLCVGTQANNFLVENMATTDHRYQEVALRRERQAGLIKELKYELKRRRLVRKGREFF